MMGKIIRLVTSFLRSHKKRKFSPCLYLSLPIHIHKKGYKNNDVFIAI